jgi:histone chaperone ASF1
VTAILLTCSYNNQEFFRVGYYVNNIYEDEELNLNPPEEVVVEKLKRHILSEKPRITKFNIDWDNTVATIPSYTNYMFNNENNKEDIQNEFGKDKHNEKSNEEVKNLFEELSKNNKENINK